MDSVENSLIQKVVPLLVFGMIKHVHAYSYIFYIAPKSSILLPT